MEALREELKSKIVKTLDLMDAKEENIGNDDQLIGGELGLDSIDVLELAIMIEKDYGVLIDNKEVGQKVFRTVTTLAEYVQQHRTKGCA